MSGGGSKKLSVCYLNVFLWHDLDMDRLSVALSLENCTMLVGEMLTPLHCHFIPHQNNLLRFMLLGVVSSQSSSATSTNFETCQAFHWVLMPFVDHAVIIVFIHKNCK